MSINENLSEPFTITEVPCEKSEIMKNIDEIIENNINLIKETTTENLKAVSWFFPDIEDVKKIYKTMKEKWIKNNIENPADKINKIKTFWFQTLRDLTKIWKFNENDVLNFMKSIEENNIEDGFKNFKIIIQWKYNERIYKRFSKETKIDNILNQLFYIKKHN